MNANQEILNLKLAPLQPLPLADLHITRRKGTPSKGGLLSSLTDVVFQIEVESSIFPMSKCTVFNANHFPDDQMF